MLALALYQPNNLLKINRITNEVIGVSQHSSKPTLAVRAFVS